MVRVYKLKYFNMYSNKKGEFIVHNTHKKFKNGHTHLNNYNTAKYIIQLAIHKSIPHTKSIYLIDSLIRVSNDSGYINNLRKIKLDIITEKENNRRK